MTSWLIVWIMIACAAFCIEAMSVQLIAIWFCIGATTSAIMNICGCNIKSQIIVFLILSILLLCTCFPILKKKIKVSNTNVNSFVGHIGVVTETIDNIDCKGQIKVDGQIWSARSVDDKNIKKGVIVEVEEIKGVTAYVHTKE